VKGRQLFIYGKAFHVRGVCYSPVPINESMLFGPYGDYFTDEYAFMWRRDFPLIAAMGANAIRIYGWDDTADHMLFLKHVMDAGLRVLITYPLGTAASTPIRGEKNRQRIIDRFANQVRKYGEHPAILGWSFGNEINMAENGFLQEFDREFVCGWNSNEQKTHAQGCYNPINPPNTSDPCYDTSYCVYDKLFRFIELAAETAHRYSSVPIMSAFADTDLILDKIDRGGHLCPSINIWALQLYRGYSFGAWFQHAQNASNSATNFKPFMITEYGVDAYHDVCGSDPLHTPCFNQVGDHSGSGEDEGAQAMWNRNLTVEIGWHSSAQPVCQPGSPEWEEVVSLTGESTYLNETCVAAGGFVYSWVDEYWKGSYTAAECKPNFWDPAFKIDKCGYKAHVTCPDWNASFHDICGQPSHGSPDGYQNEEWFGMTSPIKCENSFNGLRLRKTYWALKEEWTDSDTNVTIVMPSCANVARCPGNCSDRGRCETDHEICGPANHNPHSGAPCCICNTGWAGPRCESFDAKTKLSIGAGFSVLLLLAACCLANALRSNKTGSVHAPQPDHVGIEQGLLLERKLLAGNQVSTLGSVNAPVK